MSGDSNAGLVTGVLVLVFGVCLFGYGVYLSATMNRFWRTVGLSDSIGTVNERGDLYELTGGITAGVGIFILVLVLAFRDRS